jgi:hypothetical protein
MDDAAREANQLLQEVSKMERLLCQAGIGTDSRLAELAHIRQLLQQLLAIAGMYSANEVEKQPRDETRLWEVTHLLNSTTKQMQMLIASGKLPEM